MDYDGFLMLVGCVVYGLFACGILTPPWPKDHHHIPRAVEQTSNYPLRIPLTSSQELIMSVN